MVVSKVSSLPIRCYACGKDFNESRLQELTEEQEAGFATHLACGCPFCGRVVWEALATVNFDVRWKSKPARKLGPDNTIMHWTPAKLPDNPSIGDRQRHTAFQGDIEAGLAKERGVRKHEEYYVAPRADQIYVEGVTFKMPKSAAITALREELAALRAELQEVKDTLMAVQVLRDVQKIAVPATQHAPGSATTRDWSKVPTDKLQAMHAKFLTNSPKWIASKAELTARGIV